MSWMQNVMDAKKQGWTPPEDQKESTVTKYIDLLGLTGIDDSLGTVGATGAARALRWLDEHPEELPGRTITESEFDREAERFPGPLLDLRTALINLGFVFVEDRKPTNADRLNSLYERWRQDVEGMGISVGEWMHRRGAKAPEGGVTVGDES